ncbi:hypothetical protein, partial [Streptomyces caniscabiei]|uniref:hypothetical protein n=1 Tax=Streptomyces caniscabiei TaxID=2746961 RepID=UPI001C4FBFDF
LGVAAGPVLRDEVCVGEGVERLPGPPEGEPGRYAQHRLLRALAAELTEMYDSPDSPGGVRLS